MIDEPELREIFAAEALENLDRMEQGLLALELTPGAPQLVESVFRQAHSLKGSAASLGLTAIESVAHRFEDVLDGARQGRHLMTPELADQLYRALDALRSLVSEAVTGRRAEVDLRQTLAALTGLPAMSSAASPDQLPSSDHQVGQTAASTVRVEIVRLDRALADTGDLVVTAARLGLRRLEVQELRELHEGWAREGRQCGGLSISDGDRLSLISARLEGLVRALSDDQARLEQITQELRETIQEMRLVPLSELSSRFPRIVRDLARQEGKEVQLVISGEETTADRRLLERLSTPLTHLIRNAVDHGVELPAFRQTKGKPSQATLHLSAERRGPVLEVVLSDDGPGLDLPAIGRRALDLGLRSQEQLARAGKADLGALIFAPGLSTRSVVSELSGRGTGLDAVRADVEGMGGTIRVDSREGQGSTFRIRIPLSLATLQVMVFSCGDSLFAVPLAHVQRAFLLSSASVFQAEGRPCIELDGNLVPISALDQVLGGQRDEGEICLTLGDQDGGQGFIIEALLGVMELVIKPFYESRLVAGASILPDGRVCLLLQPAELLRVARDLIPAVDKVKTESVVTKPASVLVVEDSPTAQAQARRTLEGAGYSVTTANDGSAGWKLACERQFAAVISDVEMPEMDGLELTRRLRGLVWYADVPVLLVTALDDEETRLAGLEAGANALLGKKSYEEGTLLQILERLL